jgi:hypothetical protein
MAAQAECLGQGCYSGIGLLIGSAIAFVIGVVLLVILIFLRRWGAVKILGALLGCVVLAVLWMVG